jgi:lysozyme family protein
MSTDVQALIDAVIDVEAGGRPNGGYTNDPDDRGGETIWGITAAVARAFGYAGPMIAMPRATAVTVYRERFWMAPHLDWVDAVPSCSPLAAKLFDIGVNMGPATGIKYLQRALNVLNNQGKSWPDMGPPDGGLGKVTLAALRAFVVQRGQEGTQVLLGMVRAQQSVDYIQQAEANPSQESFEYGWQRWRALGSLTA